MNDSERLLRFKSRVIESETFKLDELDFQRQKWREDIERYNEKLKDDERERVYREMRNFKGIICWDSIEDIIQSLEAKFKDGK